MSGTHTGPYDYPRIDCRYCKTTGVHLTYNEETIKKLLEQGACHECGFWIDQAEADEDPDRGGIVTPDYGHYVVGDEDANPGPRGSFRGFGGEPFTVYWISRAPTTTTNLWSQGNIPEIHRHRFTINAMIKSGRGT